MIRSSPCFVKHTINERIRRKVYYLMMAVAVLAAILAVNYWPTLATKEPVVDGKPLSFWLDEYRQSRLDDPRKKRAEAAIRECGTNAIPHLLRMLTERDGVVAAMLAEHPRICDCLGARYKPAWVRNAEGEAGFEALGDNASSAVPRLIHMYEQPSSPSSQMYVAASLADIGQAALPAAPALLRGLTNNSNAGARLVSFDALFQMHADPGKLVPTLVKWLGDTDVVMRTGAAVRLGRYGAQAREAIPALRRVSGRVLGRADLIAIQKIEGTK
jgi:hypothetical protein